MEYKIVEKITMGGSDRIFYRCLKGKETCILVWDKDVKNYLKWQKHLYDRGIGVPKIHWADESSNLLLIEDVGSDSLYELSKKKRSVYSLYKTAIKELVKLQVYGYPDAPVKNYYDYKHIKWEQDYFKKYFLSQLCKISGRKLKKLETDFECLARELLGKAKPWTNFLMHRDYQSQNIYIKNKKT